MNHRGTVGLSIEYGHVYADEACGAEQRESAVVAARAAAAERSYETVVLVDEYNVRDEFDCNDLVAALSDAGCRPSAIIFESDLVEPAELLLSLITRHRIRSRHERYRQKHSKLTCSLLTAAWYLVRLGALDGDLRCQISGQSLRPADRLLNVLPTAYVGVEAEVREIIRHSPYAAVLQRIGYEWTRAHDGELWERFKPSAYLEHNYNGRVHPCDRRIVQLLADSWEGIGDVQSVVEVGGGPNMYPVLAALPYAQSIAITDFSQPNCAYVTTQLDRLDERWWRFWELLAAAAPCYRVDRDSVQSLLRRRAGVHRQDIYGLPAATWDVASMHFCAESITGDRAEFSLGCQRLCEAVRPAGHVLASFMLGSNGYVVGGVTFPAVSVTLSDLEAEFAKHCDDIDVFEIDQGPALVRAGYSGMAFVRGRRKSADETRRSSAATPR